MVYSESGLKVDKSSKTTDTINGTILVDATNQNPASICTLEKYYVTESTAGSAVITMESQVVPYVCLQRNCDSNMPHFSWYNCTNNKVKHSISELSFLIDQRTERVAQWIRWNWQSQSQCGCQMTGLDWPHHETTTAAKLFLIYFTYISIHNVTNKVYLHSSYEENLQNKPANLYGNFFGGLP